MKNNHLTQTPGSRPLAMRRRGFTTPAVAIALLVTMCGLAMILDRLWLDTADLELTTAAEGAALAAASRLASDDLLRPNADPEQALDLARIDAAWIASQNVVAGTPVILDTSLQGDVRLGRLILETELGKVQFIETAVCPTTAVVTARRTRQSSNPVALFMAGATGQPYGDVVSRVEASIDNRVCGVRPLIDVPVPALPMAIWLTDPSGLRVDTWQTQIQARQGQDAYGYDSIGQRVFTGSDGIPEIVLRSQASGQKAAASNMLVLDVGTGLNDLELGRQFASGWTADDLNTFGGEMCVTAATPVSMRASAELRNADRQALDTLIGQPRICLLYSAVAATGNTSDLMATCVQMVAIRVLAVADQPDGSCSVVVQPCVLKTKTAILAVSSPYSTDSVVPVSPYSVPATVPTGTASGTNASNSTPNTTTTGSATTAGTVNTGTSGSPITCPGNPYIYKLHLTH